MVGLVNTYWLTHFSVCVTKYKFVFVNVLVNTFLIHTRKSEILTFFENCEIVCQLLPKSISPRPEHANHIQCGGFKICPQILWKTFLGKVDINFPPFIYGLDLMMLLIGRIWWKQWFMNSETNLLNLTQHSPNLNIGSLFCTDHPSAHFGKYYCLFTEDHGMSTTLLPRTFNFWMKKPSPKEDSDHFSVVCRHVVSFTHSCPSCTLGVQWADVPSL